MRTISFSDNFKQLQPIKGAHAHNFFFCQLQTAPSHQLLHCHDAILKTTLNSAKFEKPVSLLVFFFALACESIFIKTHSTENRSYRTVKYTVCRCNRAAFSPETVLAVAVKGLKSHLCTTSFSVNFKQLQPIKGLHAHNFFFHQLQTAPTH